MNFGSVHERALPDVENIDHTRTKVKSPQTDGIAERFHKTVLTEFYRVAFRRKILLRHRKVAARPRRLAAPVQPTAAHQGRWCYGKTPLQTFVDSVQLAKEKMVGPTTASAEAESLGS